MNKIYCIGDSHVNFFKDDERFEVLTVGAATAYNLKKIGTVSGGREKLFDYLNKIKKGKTVLLCFGEIDCRCHLFKNKNIDRCVNRYFDVIQEIKKLGYNVMVWGVIPSMRREMTPNEIKKYGNYPVLGSCSERNVITKLFNTKLQKLCDEVGIKFISIFNELLDDNGLTNTEYYEDPIHLSKVAMKFVKL